MKLMTEEQLLDLLAQAWRRGCGEGARGVARGKPVPADPKIARDRVMDLVHADAGGFDSKGQEVGRG